jgi:tetratricopeptide (TPR) repeat protein
MDGGLAGLQPAVLGETLIGEALAQDDELLDAAFGPASSREDIRHALTVLTRLGRRVPSEQRWLKNALTRNLTKISEDALQVGIETGWPLPEIHAQVLGVAAPQERRRAVDILRTKLPGTTLNLANFSIEIRRQAVAFLEKKKTGSPEKRHIALSEALPLLAAALRGKGLLDEAAEVAAEAVRHASLVFRSDKEYDRRRLGSVLGNVGGHLSDVGRFEEALKAAEKAESLRRGLAEKQPDAYTPRLGEIAR